MERSFKEIEELLPGYLSGDLQDTERLMIDEWRRKSSEHETLFQESLKAWEVLPLLQEMERFNSFEALKKINPRLSNQESTNWWQFLQRVAAILLLPLIIYSGYLSIIQLSLKNQQQAHVVMQTISSRQGMVTQFELSDGTRVWLNSGSALEFPSLFTGHLREVNLSGEGFFEVTRNERHPFLVKAKDLNIEVLGTSFNVVSYEDEKQAEVVLIEGKVQLSVETTRGTSVFGSMDPGQRVIYNQDTKKMGSEEVTVDKYIAWRDGDLIFRDDKMEDVVKRLSRWFNVEIIVKDPEINHYEYKATFRNETLTQVLNLLKISAPIDYQIIGNQLLPNGEYSKQKVLLMKNKI